MGRDGYASPAAAALLMARNAMLLAIDRALGTIPPAVVWASVEARVRAPAGHELPRARNARQPACSAGASPPWRFRSYRMLGPEAVRAMNARPGPGNRRPHGAGRPTFPGCRFRGWGCDQGQSSVVDAPSNLCRKDERHDRKHLATSPGAARQAGARLRGVRDPGSARQMVSA